MKITRRAQLKQLPDVEPALAAHFNGRVGIHPLQRAVPGQPVSVAVVRFHDGTRNDWHRHGGGQVLHVIEGEGFVQQRGHPPVRIRVGDSVSADPQEEHWHGAAPGSSMTHIAVNVGETTWLERPAPKL